MNFSGKAPLRRNVNSQISPELLTCFGNCSICFWREKSHVTDHHHRRQNRIIRHRRQPIPCMDILPRQQERQSHVPVRVADRKCRPNVSGADLHQQNRPDRAGSQQHCRHRNPQRHLSQRCTHFEKDQPDHHHQQRISHPVQYTGKTAAMPLARSTQSPCQRPAATILSTQSASKAQSAESRCRGHKSSRPPQPPTESSPAPSSQPRPDSSPRSACRIPCAPYSA